MPAILHARRWTAGKFNKKYDENPKVALQANISIADMHLQALLKHGLAEAQVEPVDEPEGLVQEAEVLAIEGETEPERVPVATTYDMGEDPRLPECMCGTDLVSPCRYCRATKERVSVDEIERRLVLQPLVVEKTRPSDGSKEWSPDDLLGDLLEDGD